MKKVIFVLFFLLLGVGLSFSNFSQASNILGHSELGLTDANAAEAGGGLIDYAFYHVTPAEYGESIASGGLDPKISPYVTKGKYLQSIEDPTIFNTKLYKQSLWPSTATKFDEGATILQIELPPNVTPEYFSPFTNPINGVPQWKLPMIDGTYGATIIKEVR